MASELRVSYEKATGGERLSGPGSDLTLGGVFIETSKALPVGALLSLEIESGTTKVAVDGRVLSLRPGGMSVGFIDLPNDVASTLGFIVATRTKRKGTMLGLGEAEEDVPQHQSAARLPASAAPPAPPAPLERPKTPAMERRAAPTPPMVRAAPPSMPPPPSAPPPALDASAVPQPQAWAPPPPARTSGPPPAWPPTGSPPLSTGKTPSPIGIIVLGIVVLLAVAAVATWLVLGGWSTPTKVG